LLTNAGISHKIDDSSGSIGRRYARTDEIAIPYAITIDFDSLKEPHTVTLRERDSMKQIRANVHNFMYTQFLMQIINSFIFIKIADVVTAVGELVDSRTSWNDILNNFPLFEQQSSSKEEN
jgi:glycyl-tRNA synthetase